MKNRYARMRILILHFSFIVEQNWFAKIRNAVETSHCGVSPTAGMLYVFVCECLADAFRDATM